MTLKDIVTSLELSKKLAKAGVSQEGGIAYWIENGITGKWEFTENYEGTIPRARAFTFNELWEMLPESIEDGKWFLLDLSKIRENGNLLIGYANMAIGILKMCSGIPQEAAGELLLWCIEQGYVNPKED